MTRIIGFREWMERENKKDFLTVHESQIISVCQKIRENMDSKLVEEIIDDVWCDAKKAGFKTMDLENIEMSVKQSVHLLNFLEKQ